MILLLYFDSINRSNFAYHFQQEGQLCAQHCLNTLLQGPYYTAVDLATIAGQLDEEERRRMAGGTAGENSEEYRRFIAQPSANMDDTGNIKIESASILFIC